MLFNASVTRFKHPSKDGSNTYPGRWRFALLYIAPNMLVGDSTSHVQHLRKHADKVFTRAWDEERIRVKLCDTRHHDVAFPNRAFCRLLRKVGEIRWSEARVRRPVKKSIKTFLKKYCYTIGMRAQNRNAGFTFHGILHTHYSPNPNIKRNYHLTNITRDTEANVDEILPHGRSKGWQS